MSDRNRSPRARVDLRAGWGPLRMAILATAMLLPNAARATEPPPISGVYEIGIGATDPEPVIAYLAQFGYQRLNDDDAGSFDAAAAKALYGVSSALTSIRLGHQDADHGLYRIMVWDAPRNDGLGLAPMKVVGGRWGAAVTRDVYAILNHAEDADAASMPVRYVAPQRQEIYPMGGEHRPFLDPAVCVREMLLIQPHARQILFQRYGYELPHYGSIAEEGHLRTSQVTHAGMVVQGGPELLRFYDEVLGLLRARDGHRSDDSEPASKAIFDLRPGEAYISTDFDDPRSVPSDLQKVRSGRLKIIRFLPDGPTLPDLRDRSRPGSIGFALYTYRVRDIEMYHRRVSESAANEVTPILRNELGERSFSFVAPDGYFFSLIEG